MRRLSDYPTFTAYWKEAPFLVCLAVGYLVFCALALCAGTAWLFYIYPEQRALIIAIGFILLGLGALVVIIWLVERAA